MTTITELIQINRVPTLASWTIAVAERIGYAQDTA